MNARQIITTAMLDRLERDGGFTINPTDLEPVKCGFAIGLGRAGGTCVIAETVAGRQAACEAAYDENLPLLLGDPRVMLGGWVDEAGRAHLEPSAVYGDREEAIRMGRMLGEEAIYDLGAGETIYVDGR
jgi:hypothetical protein